MTNPMTEPLLSPSPVPPSHHFDPVPPSFVAENQIPHGFPTIDMGPQLKVVERTRTATMLCAASGNPDPEISWFKDFLPVDIGGSNGRIKQLRSGTHFFPRTRSSLWKVRLSKNTVPPKPHSCTCSLQPVSLRWV